MFTFKMSLFLSDSSTDSQENGLLIQHRPSLQSVESERGTSNFTKEGPRRHSNFTNSSLNFLSSSSIQADIKPTGGCKNLLYTLKIQIYLNNYAFG